MSVVSPNDADYIDRISDYQTGFRQLSTDLPLEAPKMTEESSEIIPIGLKRDLKQRIADLQANSAFKMLLSIRRIAHLYEEETRLRTRVRLIKTKIEQRDEINRIEMIKMNMLRAERAKASENMVFINSKSIELDSRITALRASIREKRSDLNKIKTESLKSGKIILSDYYRTINASRNVDSLSKMVPVIKPQLLTDIKCSSKTKKQMEESSIISESFSIARFLNWSSAIFQYPLRFDANNQFIQNHHEIGQSGSYQSFTYLDPKAFHFLQANLFHLEGCRMIKKSSSLEKFLLSSFCNVEIGNINGSIRKTDSKTMRNALFSRTGPRKPTKNETKYKIGESDIPDLT